MNERENQKQQQRKKEFSKVIVVLSLLECWAVTVAALYFAYTAHDTSVFMYLIPSSWGSYGIAKAFYYNKAKAENQVKLKKEFTEAGLPADDLEVKFQQTMDKEISSNF